MSLACYLIKITDQQTHRLFRRTDYLFSDYNSPGVFNLRQGINL